MMKGFLHFCLFVLFCFLYIKGDFLVKLGIECSTLIVLVLQKHNHVYI